MFLRHAFVTALCTFFVSAPLAAAQTASVDVPTATGGADISIYNNDFGMVRERRVFRLPSSPAQIVLGGISNQLQPETAFLQSLKGDALKVTEQIFNFDVMTPNKLLEHAVGQEVSVVTTSPATGRETITRARILSVSEGLVLEIEGKIHFNHPGRIVLDSVPAGLRAKPSLSMTVTGPTNQDVDAEFSYLTGGLSWRADYVAQYDADAGRMDLMAWATITNTTGRDYPDAKLKLVAGDVNRAPPAVPPPMVMRGMKADMAMAAASPVMEGVTQAASLATHVYTIGKPTSLVANETKQLGLLSSQGIAVRRQFTVRSQPHFYTSQIRGPQESRVNVELLFKNDAAAKLGAPLPAGTIRVYGQDAQGAPQFMGEDRINATPEGSDVTLQLGTDFDISVTREQTNYVRASDTITLTVWRVTLSNAKPRPVTVRLIEPLPGSWEIVKESHPHRKLDASSALWTLDIPAKGRTVLEYNVRTTF